MLETQNEAPVFPQTYTGTDGHLEYADGRWTSCSFEIVQEDDGNLSLVCEHDQNGWVWAEGLGGPSPCRLRARTKDGITLLAEGEFVQIIDLPDSPPPSRGVQVRYHVNGPGVRLMREDVEPGPVQVRFALVNCPFWARVPTRYDRDDGGYRVVHDTLPLSLGGRPVSLVKVPNYRHVVDTLRARPSVAVTCAVNVVSTSVDEIDAVTRDVDRLCALLTLATGTKVTWISYDARSTSGEIKAGLLRSAPIRPFSTFTLIDTQDADGLAQFVDATFVTFGALELSFELPRVIDARVDVISGGFLETRTLMAGVLADYLTGRFGMVNGHQVRSFEERLRFMVKQVCPDVRGKDISKLIKNRDMLAHEMRFRTTEKHVEYRAVMHVVNRLVLGLLGYSGPYVDCRTWQVVDPNDSPSSRKT